MTLQQTLGGLADALTASEIKKAKQKVKEVEDLPRFAAVKTIIGQMVIAASPTTPTDTEDARDNALTFHIRRNPTFGLAVKRRVLQFVRTGT